VRRFAGRRDTAAALSKELKLRPEGSNAVRVTVQCPVADVALFTTLAAQGLFMGLVAYIFGAAIVLAFFLDAVKVALFRRIAIA
jgi:hypothetical protein